MLLLFTSLGWHVWPGPVGRGPRPPLINGNVPPAASWCRTPVMDMAAAGRKDGDAAMLLQLVSQTAMMEGMLRQQSKGIDVLQPNYIRREYLLQSVSKMLRNSNLASIPGGGEAAAALASISSIAEAGYGDLSPDELIRIAGQYGATQAELQRVLEALPLAETA